VFARRFSPCLSISCHIESPCIETAEKIGECPDFFGGEFHVRINKGINDGSNE
jgi:hypothetical protein